MRPDPPVFVFWYDFSRWLLEKTEKFPKKVRFSFTIRIENLALDIVGGIIEARYSGEKKLFCGGSTSTWKNCGCCCGCAMI